MIIDGSHRWTAWTELVSEGKFYIHTGFPEFKLVCPLAINDRGPLAGEAEDGFTCVVDFITIKEWNELHELENFLSGHALTTGMLTFNIPARAGTLFL